jgi:hypothetical protein
MEQTGESGHSDGMLHRFPGGDLRISRPFACNRRNPVYLSRERQGRLVDSGGYQ